MISRKSTSREQKSTGCTTTLSRTSQYGWVYATETDYVVSPWYQDEQGIYHNKKTGASYNSEIRLLNNGKESGIQELTMEGHLQILAEITSTETSELPLSFRHTYINEQTLQIYHPATRSLSSIHCPSVIRTLTELEHQQLMLEIEADERYGETLDHKHSNNEEREMITNDNVSSEEDPSDTKSDDDEDGGMMKKLLKPLKIGTKQSIFLAGLRLDTPCIEFMKLLERKYCTRLMAVIACLEQGKFGVRWLTLTLEEKAVVVRRIALALRIVGNYMVLDEGIYWQGKTITLAELFSITKTKELSQVRGHHDAETTFDPREEDIADYFAEDEGEYLIIHGSFIFGPENAQPGDIDLIIPMLDPRKADKEVAFELLIGNLEDGLQPADFAKIYRINDLHPSPLGSEMDAYLGIPLWGKVAIGTTIAEEWQTILPDFQKLSSKVLDEGRPDSNSKRTRKLVDLAMICHHFLLWMQKEDMGDQSLEIYIENIKEVVQQGNATLLRGSFTLSRGRLTTTLEEIMNIAVYITDYLGAPRKSGRKKTTRKK